MPLYYFDLWDGQRFHFDGAGVERHGPEDAFEEAVHMAQDMWRDAALTRQEISGWVCVVRDEAGKPLFGLPFSIAGVDQHYDRPISMLSRAANERRRGSHLRR